MNRIEVGMDGGVLKYIVQTSIDLVSYVPSAIPVRPGLYLVVVNIVNAMAMQSAGLDMRGYEPLRFPQITTLPKVDGTEPLELHQIETASFIAMNKRCMVLSTQRTGKTASAICGGDYLQRTGLARGVLVIATLTTLPLVWKADIEAMLPQAAVTMIRDAKAIKTVTTRGDRVYMTQHRPALSGIKMLRMARREAQLAPHRQAWYLINPDKLRNDLVTQRELMYMMEEGEISMVIIDESTAFGNVEAGRRQALADILSAANKYPHVRDNFRVVPMSATPGGPRKVYSQAQLCDPVKCCISLEQWEMHTMIRYPKRGKFTFADGGSINAFEMRPKPDWPVHIARYLPPSILFSSDGMFDFEEELERIRVPMSAEQKEVYDTVLKEAVLPYRNRVNEMTRMDIKHMMTKITKTLQISTGTVLTDTDVVSHLDYSPRLDILCQLIDSTNKKVIIFNTYRETCGRLVEDLISLGYSAVEVTGDVVGAKRTKALNDFQKGGDKSAKVLVCHPKTVAHGVEGAAADVIIFNGPVTCGAEYYEQGKKRASSRKQKSKVIRIYELSGSPVEDKYWYSLHDKIGLEEIFLKMIKDAQ